MGLLAGVVNVVKTVVETTTTLISPLIGPLANVLGSAGSAATGIAGYLVSVVSGTGYAAFPLLGIVTSFIGATISLTGNTPPSIPFPNPIVKVETYSGSVHRTSYVPIGGVPVAIDVDNGMFFGVLKPDINVAVGLISPAPTGLNSTLIQPSITIAREPLAAKSGHPAPPLNISTQIQLKDAFNDFKEFATIDYGYDTPPGGRVPPLVRATVTGPVESGFVDPLKAKLEVPGYSAPLKFIIGASTPSLKADFGIKFNPMPNIVNLVEDPRDDGLDAHYDHSGPIADIKMDADISMLNRVDNSLLKIGASIERLPRTIDLANTNTASQTLIDFKNQTDIKPADVRATYQDFAPNGSIVTDADIRVSALPKRITGKIDTVPKTGGGSELDAVDFRVLDGEEIGAVDFLVKNYLGAPGTVPEPNLGPRQFVTLGMRRIADGSSRYRAAGRIEGIRSATFFRTGATKKGYDVTTDIGSGTKQLRAIFDMDDRGPGAPVDAQWFKMDARVTPLPRQIHAVFLPGAGATQPTDITYDSPQVIDVTADATIARGTANGCGQVLVTCLQARVDKVPTHLGLKLPGTGGTDYAVSHNGGSATHPDIRATVDNTPEIASERLWAQIEALRLPNEIRARIDTSAKKVMRTAEFHGCAWDYTAAACTDAQQAVGRVRFTVRDNPTRNAILPQRPDQAATFVSMIKRPAAYEIQGRVDEIRNVRFRQRDLNNDGLPDGNVGVLVDAGVGGPFDAYIDQLGPDETQPTPKPDTSSIINAHVASLPTRFTACYRSAVDTAPAAIAAADADPLLGPCDRRDLLGRSDGQLTRTPLSIDYTASQPTAVSAALKTRAVDNADKIGTSPVDHTKSINVSVDQVPTHMRADVLLPVDDELDASKARPLEARYESSAAINAIDLSMDDRRTDGSPTPTGSYVEAHVTGVPTRVSAKIDTARKVMRRADFHACDYNFSTEACGDAQQTLGSVEFLTRPQRRRGALPAIPAHAPSFVSLIKRLDNSEVTGRIAQIRNVSFRQRDDAGDGKADGTLGVLVDAGVGGSFDAHVDQMAPDDNYPVSVFQPTASTVLDAHVATLGTLLKACFRQAADAVAPSPGSLSPDALMSPCDSNNVLGHQPSTPTALSSTPLTIDYQSSVPTLVTAKVRSDAQNKDDSDKRHTSDMAVTIDKVPASLHADLIPGRDVVPASGPDPELPARPLQFAYKASAPINALDLELENRRNDETSSESDLYAKAKVTGIPSALSGEMDTALKVLRRAEFHGCTFNYVTRTCTDAQQEIDNVQFTVRPKRQRGELPPQVQPANPASDFVSLVKRFDNSEITGQVHAIRNVAFHQRDENLPGGKGDGKPDGTLGIQVDAGTGGSFDAHIDQLQNDVRDDVPGFNALSPTPTSSTVLDAHVDNLPANFRACLRSPHEGPQPSVSADPLLSDCDSTPVTTINPEPVATPLSLVYNASGSAHVTATINSRALDTEDLPNPNAAISNSNKPFDHTSKLFADVTNVPTYMRADVMPSLTTDAAHPNSRRLQVAYDASAPIGEVKFATENRRSSSLCLDPRSGRQATCFSARVVNIPKSLDVTFDPDQSRGALDIKSGPPAPGQPLSIHDIVYQATAPDSNGHPLSATADLTNIPTHITGRIAQYDPPGPTKKDLGVVRFNACPDGPCAGIGSITFDATNSLVDSALPGIPGSPEPGVTQSFSMVQRGDDFRARGNINNLREVGLSRLTPADDAANAQLTPPPTGTVKETKHIRAAFGAGPGEKLRAYLDTDDGKGSLLMDAIVKDSPDAINLCLRDAIDTTLPAGNDPYLGAGDFCDVAPKKMFAISAGLDVANPTVKPDIIVHRLRQANAAGTKILTGTASIEDLGARINATVDKSDRGGVLVEGRDLSNNLANVAGRVTFDLRNFDGTPSTAFPFGPMTDNTDPTADNRNDDIGSPPNAGRNFVVVGQDGQFLRLQGSIPAVKRVGLAPGACDQSDTAHFPDPEDPAWGAGRAPSYTCIQAALGAGRPLGFAVRTRKQSTGVAQDVLALEEGHINAVPTAGDGLRATVGSSPSENANLPACGTTNDLPVTTTSIPCKPELLSVVTDPGGGPQPILEARAFMGPQALIEQLRTAAINDPFGARTAFDQHPRDFAENGVRVKVGTKKTGLPAPNDSNTAVRVGLKIPIPRWLDVDQPTFYSCTRKSVAGPCEKTTAGDNSRTAASDIFVKFVAADDFRFGGAACDGSPSCYLGRVALDAHDFDKNTDTIVGGVAPSDTGNGTSGQTPENGAPGGPETARDRGFQLPRHLDARIQIRENHSGSDPRYSTNFIQADMRLNAPVSLSARLSGTGINVNRSGNSVPSMVATVRNLAGLSDGVTNFTNPTQRARIILKGKEEDPGFFDCGGAGLGISIPALAHACLITPHPHTRWINVDLNADPTGPNAGDPPARDIAAIVDQTDKNQVELRGFTDTGQGTPAKFGARAGLRLEPFALGARVGGGIGLIGGYLELTLDGDLIVGTSNNPSSRLRLSNNAGALRLATANGGSNVDVDLREGLRAKIVGEALFGLVSVTLLNVSTPRIPVPVAFRTCDPPSFGLFGSVNHFDTTSSQKAGLTLGGGFPSSLLSSGPVTALLDLLPPAFCAVFSTSDSVLDAPQPGYEEPGRQVIGVSAATPPPPPPPAPQVNPLPQNITISTDTLTCAPVLAADLHITNNSFLFTGPPGTTDSQGNACDGRLIINADTVRVDAGSLISSTGQINVNGAGTGAPNAGAGHSGVGGNGPGGAIGGPSVPAPSDVDTDIGFPAADVGSLQGGNGGGVVAITATRSIQVNGTIRANGTAGGDNTTACGQAAGGGSGGRVRLTANRVTVAPGGAVQANGGAGGNGGNRAGGGGGGRVQIDRIALQNSGTIQAAGGGVGTLGGGCAAANAGGTGNTSLGDSTIARGGTISVTNANANGFVRGSADLHISAVDRDGGDIQVIVCRRSVAASTSDGFNSTALDPGSVSVNTLLNDNCQTHDFDASDATNTVEYDRDITVSGLGNAYYGFYAFVAIPLIPGTDCGGFFSFSCTYQTILPSVAQTRFASDNVAPTLDQPLEELSGSTTNCPGARNCQTEPVGIAKILPKDDFSGIAFTGCRVNGPGSGGTFPITPCEGSSAPIDFGGTQGNMDVHVRFIDRAGNEATFDNDLQWRIDSNVPNTPVITVNYPDLDVNGWHKQKPAVTVSVTDVAPSAGFGQDPIQFIVDGGGTACGGPPSPGPAVSCSAATLAPEVPDEGIHRLDAYATDLLGNESARRDNPNTELDNIEIKIDKTKPTSKLFLGPNTPDGAAGWYQTNPIIAFAASDSPGGSGVDLNGLTTPSGVFFSIDGGTFTLFDPTFGVGSDQVVPDGIHNVCWYSVDLAGNIESTQCRNNIKVDNQAPNPAAALTPPAFDGSNGWHVTEPHYALTGNDGTGSGINTALNPNSDIFVSVDGGRFEAYDGSDPNDLSNGDRELCWYAVDVAGNLGGLGTPGTASCKRLKVDTTRPPQVDPYVDPAAPDGTNGWYKVKPFLDFAQRDQEGGSGGESSQTVFPSGTKFSVDGSPYIYWNPLNNAVNGLADGNHTVCWRGIDIAGNGGNSDSGCKVVKVDTKAPTATAPIVPAVPNGNNSYYTVQPTISPAGSDPAGGSGLDRVEAQVDGGNWVVAAAVVIPEGEHNVRVRAVDKAGNFSPIIEQTVRYDGSDPGAFTGTYPPLPNDQGWFRQPVRQSIAVEDGRDNSGEDGATYQVDGGAQVSYLEPFFIGEGNHVLTVRPRDRAGRVGAPVASNVRVDLTPPVPVAIPLPTGQPRTILLPFQSTAFQFNVTDNLSTKTRVRVMLIDVLGNVVRELPVPGDAQGYIPTGNGSVAWDGSLANGKKALPGLYHYRVQSTDQAGNTAQSSEGASMLLVLGAGAIL